MDPEVLLDPAPVTPEQFDHAGRQVAGLLGTAADVVLLQAEATVALEAVAKSTGWPGTTVLNVVSGPYGRLTGSWLADAGATVVEVVVPFDQAPGAEQVRQMLDRHSPSAVFLAHAEAATGTVCALGDIAAAVKDAGALLVVDAVASVGAEPLDIDGWDLGICVVGAQKAMAGPAGISAVTLNPAAWSWIERHPAPPRRSVLSLIEWKERWIDSDRRRVPVIPAPLEVAALSAAVDRLADEGLEATVGRHRRAAAASRAGIVALGLTPWVPRAADTAAVATTVALPHGPDLSDAELASLVSAGVAPGPGTLADQLLRINHTGRAARLDVVLEALGALAQARPAEASGRSLDEARAAISAWDD